MAGKWRSRLGRAVGRLRRDFLAGLVAIVPLAATILILKWVFVSIDGIVGPVVRVAFGRPVAGIGFALSLVVIYLVGAMAANVLGRKAIQYGESLMNRVPVARAIYATVKQVMEGFVHPDKGAFKEVVLVEFPRPGMATIGFVTNRMMDSSGQELLNVYIPTTPNPTSGFLEIVPPHNVIATDLTVEEAIKMVVSGGILSPTSIGATPFQTAQPKSPQNPLT